MHISNLILTLIKKYNSLTPKLLSGREKAPSQTISVLYAFLLLQHKQTIQEVEDEDKSEDESGAQKGGPVRSGLSRLGSPAAKVESSHFCWDLPSPISHPPISISAWMSHRPTTLHLLPCFVKLWRPGS